MTRPRMQIPLLHLSEEGAGESSSHEVEPCRRRCAACRTMSFVRAASVVMSPAANAPSEAAAAYASGSRVGTCSPVRIIKVPPVWTTKSSGTLVSACSGFCSRTDHRKKPLERLQESPFVGSNLARRFYPVGTNSPVLKCLGTPQFQSPHQVNTQHHASLTTVFPCYCWFRSSRTGALSVVAHELAPTLL